MHCLAQSLPHACLIDSRAGTSNDHLHSPADWVNILTVWLGKLASEAPPYRSLQDPKAMEAFRKRLTQLTAIGLAAREMVEP